MFNRIWYEKRKETSRVHGNQLYSIVFLKEKKLLVSIAIYCSRLFLLKLEIISNFQMISQKFPYCCLSADRTLSNYVHNGDIWTRLLAALKSENYQAIDAIKKANERRFQIEDFDVSKLVEDPFSTNFVDEEIKSSVFASVGPKWEQLWQKSICSEVCANFL